MHKERTLSRQYAVQALYQWVMTQQEAQEIEQQFIDAHNFNGSDFEYFQEILHQSIIHQPSLADLTRDFLSRPFEQIDPVEQSILLLGCYELQYRLDVPYKVIINESVELGKEFGAEDGYRFINGILDKVAAKIRPDEVK